MFLTGLVSVMCLVLGFTNGYPSFQARIPNGDRVSNPCKPKELWLGVGHRSPAGNDQRNPFGVDWKANGLTWNRTICQMDSDGDGLTNGQELGDPECTWTNGTTPSRTANITHPGICAPFGSPRCAGQKEWLKCDDAGFTCPAVNESETRNITFRFPKTPVPNTKTNYMCMTFDLPNDKLYHLVASTPVIDSKVVHHILVYSCDGDGIPGQNPPELSEATECEEMYSDSWCSSIIALWAPGNSGYCLDHNTGYLFGSGAFTRIKMQIHWNNPDLRSDFTDSSGLTLYYTAKLRPTSAATLVVGQLTLEIPPLLSSVSILGGCSSDCTSQGISNNITVVGLVHHMHLLGRRQVTELFRNGIKVSTLANETNFDYNFPIANKVDPPVQILPGDEVRTTCTYSSLDRSSNTSFGPATSDEMCFVFMIVYPKENLPRGTMCLFDFCPADIDDAISPVTGTATDAILLVTGNAADAILKVTGNAADAILPGLLYVFVFMSAAMLF